MPCTTTQVEADVKRLMRIENRGYRLGYLAALRDYAWLKDGTQYVGSCGKTLADAVAQFNTECPEGE